MFIDTIIEIIVPKGRTMAVASDIFELKHKFYDQDNRELENVYYYQWNPASGGATSTANQLVTDWIADVLTPMKVVLPVAYRTYEITARNLFNAADKHVRAVDIPGERAGGGGAPSELLPAFVTGVVTAVLDIANVRKGRKMFSGLMEGDQIAGVLTGGGLAVMATRALMYVLDLHNAGLGVYRWWPVVVGRIREGMPGSYTYRLPTNATEAVVGQIQSAVSSILLSSQVTRKD